MVCDLLNIAAFKILMPYKKSILSIIYKEWKLLGLLLLIFSSCTIPRKYQKDKPFVFKNEIEIKNGNFSNEERSAIKSRLNAQLDDSSKISTKDVLFFLHYIDKPPAFDTASAAKSVLNMQASMLHLGYYSARADYTADTVKEGQQQRMHIKYNVDVNKPTLIDTVSYRLRKPEFQELATRDIKKSLLQKNNPVSKSAVLGEIGRLVELFRNNGYYKFTSDELKVRGDTSLEILTNISGDPFEQLQALAEAQAKKDSPKIKLQVILNLPKDSTKLTKYHIGNVYILPDYVPGDKINDPAITERITRSGNYIIRFHNRIFKNNFLLRNVYLRKGTLYRQDDYYKTINSLSKAGVWQNVNIIINERKDSSMLDMIIQLIPGSKYNFQASLEASYSTNSNSNNATVAGSGNLIGLSGNVAILNRNLAKEGIKMTHTLRAGIEFNKNRSGQSANDNIINSNEASYSNSIIFPKLIFPFDKLNNKNLSIGETFINTGISFINRINLFNQQTMSLGVGYNYSAKPGKQWVFKPLNVEYSRLYNRTIEFDNTLDANPFLRYSFTNALVAGLINVSYASNFTNPRNTKKQHSFKWKFEESGTLLGAMGLFKNYLRRFVKSDVEYTYSRSYKKSAIITRIFAGAGIPTSKKDTTLPFFKQYFGGGSNSMRGWPVRGIGRGSQQLADYDKNIFNDRTGDIQLEGNFEYRYDITQIIPNTLILRGALFADIGNVWNVRNSKASGTDSAQFRFKNIYKDLGISAGTGFRLDFNYFVLRFDFGFRFKRPEDRYNGNNGWNVPSLSFNDAFQKIFTRGKNDEYRKWRYENFNLTIGIGYSFN